MNAVELTPLTEHQREAIRSLRFVTPFVGHAFAIGITRDLAMVQTLVPGAGLSAEHAARARDENPPACAGATKYQRSRDPFIEEWELQFSHPDAVALVCDLAASRAQAGR